MKAPTEVDICAEYFYNNMLKYKGIHISRRRFYNADIEQLKNKHSDLWPYFTAIIKKLSEYKNIDYKDFIAYVAKSSKSFYHPKILLTYQAFALYNPRYNELKLEKHKYEVYRNVLLSINFVCKLCDEKNIESFGKFSAEYIYCAPGSMPKISQYILSRDICPEFIVLCSNFVAMIKNWPIDLRLEAGLNKSKIANTIKIAKEGMYIKTNNTICIEDVVNKRIKELVCRRKNQ